jgi:anti-anti-sigma regulatory factor
LDFIESTGLHQLVRATLRARVEQRRVVLVQGKQPIDRIFAASGVDRAVGTTADPATLDPLRP